MTRNIVQHRSWTFCEAVRKESSNVFNTPYIKYLFCFHPSPILPMDNVLAPRGAVSSQFTLLSLIYV